MFGSGSIAVTRAVAKYAWRPWFRFAVYAFVGFAFARLVIFVFKRKFWPDTVTRGLNATGCAVPTWAHITTAPE